MTSPETEFVSILGAAENPDAPPRISSRSLPETLPILGLSDIVIFPGAVVPLLVETGPSLKLIDDMVAGDRLLGAVLQRKPEVAEPAPEDLHEVGCVSRLAKMVKFPDGTARVLVEGLWRIRVKEFPPPAPYLRAQLRTAARRDGGFRRIAGHAAQRAQAVRGNRQDVPRAVRPGQDRRAEHRASRPFRRPHRREFEPAAWKTARNCWKPFPSANGCRNCCPCSTASRRC